ncbi:uncharacterized protein LOC126561140 [Anopheles maculipalpis]|uniref:uncharacterized protein LOC126561140 n=1 Tax=Anopheles maculipalpis TaxID=1496333 RepID=UPI002158C8FB|nr:uncharacterized protein LOC126561140 [Anopheles maculipalpis]
MSDPKSVPFGKDLYCQNSTPSQKGQKKPASSVVMLNGVPIPTTYADKCRLCLGDKFDKNCTTIIEEQFSYMLQKVFSFPITNKIGLPMNVCGKCFRKVRIFQQFSAIVWNNQRRLEESLSAAAALEKKNNPTSTEKEYETMDADLPGVTITADAGNDPLVEPPDEDDAEQTHFVSVASQDNFFFYNEMDDIGTFDNPHTDYIQEVSLVIELDTSTDEVSDVDSEAGYQQSKNRRKNAKRVRHNVPEVESFTETRLQAKVVTDAMKNINKSKKSKR